MKKHTIYCILAEPPPDGEPYIVGVMVPGLGQTPCVGSKRELVEKLWHCIAPDIQKIARIAKMVEQ